MRKKIKNNYGIYGAMGLSSVVKGMGGFTKDIKINPEVAEKLKAELFEWDGEFYPKVAFEWKNPDDLYKLCINQQIEINRLRSINRTQRNKINVEKKEVRYLRNLNSKYSNQLDQYILLKDRAIEFVERYLRVNLEAFDTKSLLEKILKILNKDVI